ncbi:MAG TPA: tetratricopeptide repeat protein, partial [Kiritimatiellia bacterium]|nr:tetratricopeptide repeat protein [Kiritimatiellia bacterium]
AAGTGLEEVEARFAEELGLREAEIAELRLQVESLLAESVRVSPAALELIAEGDRLLVLGLLDEARDLFLGALDIDPELVDARLGLAAWAFDAGRLDEVRLTVAEVLAEDPENARAISLKGLVLWQDGEFMAAKDALEQAIRLSPNESQFFNYLGIIRFDLGDEAGSLASFGRAVELDGGNPGALYNYAFALARQPEADMDLARTMYEEALRQGSPPDEELERILFP